MGYLAVADDFQRALVRMVVIVALGAATLIGLAGYVGYRLGRNAAKADLCAPGAP